MKGGTTAVPNHSLYYIVIGIYIEIVPRHIVLFAIESDQFRLLPQVLL